MKAKLHDAADRLAQELRETAAWLHSLADSAKALGRREWAAAQCNLIHRLEGRAVLLETVAAEWPRNPDLCHHATLNPETGKSEYRCPLPAEHPGPHED